MSSSKNDISNFVLYSFFSSSKFSLHIYIYIYIYDFCYGVSEVPDKYLRFPLISTINFYYIINKLIILVPDPH
jgi:dolichyl-phosphate-mannose--protein O-mannosyl transferase